MNTEFRMAMVSKVAALVSAAVVALVLTWVASWSFVDSTRVVHWISAADAVAVTATDTSTAAGVVRAGLLQ